jgi:hypothetical protein
MGSFLPGPPSEQPALADRRCEYVLLAPGPKEPFVRCHHHLSASARNYGDVSPVPRTDPRTPGASSRPARPYPGSVRSDADLRAGDGLARGRGVSGRPGGPGLLRPTYTSSNLCPRVLSELDWERFPITAERGEVLLRRSWSLSWDPDRRPPLSHLRSQVRWVRYNKPAAARKMPGRCRGPHHVASHRAVRCCAGDERAKGRGVLL